MSRRYDVIGCQITPVTFQGALEAVIARVRTGKGGYICFTNVHASVMARHDPAYQKVVNESLMSLPDGVPIFWIGRLRGIRNLGRVSGMDFLPAFLAEGSRAALRHYFYGSRPDTLAALVEQFKVKYPSAIIAGMESPAFRELTDDETEQALRRIRSSGANIVWVGLGAPKQEKWMADNWHQLKPAVLLGVGAAFDLHAGEVSRAPLLMQRLGLEWIFRLLQEPRRLWKRYAYFNTLFVFFLLVDLLSGRWIGARNSVD